MKKTISILLALCLVFTGAQTFGFADNPPQMPPDGMGNPPDGMPPAGMGQPPEGLTPPDGMPGGPGGMPGGHSSFSGEYKALVTISEDTELTESVYSEGTDEVGILVTDGDVAISDVTVFRNSDNSTGGDNSSFYGVGSAILATGGNVTISNATIETDSAGGAGIFSYGDGIITVSDSVITTQRGTSGGIHVAGGGTLYAENLAVTTNGASSAAIRSDRGSGTMVVNGGSYTSNGSGSPAVYVTADITVSDAVLTATGSEALCLEGLNSVHLINCTLTGDMPDQEQNDNTWTVILYQSMSGDADIGQGVFKMEGGKLVSLNGGLFYTTNTESAFTLRNVEIERGEDSEYFLRCTGNANQRGWGKTGSNGADCTFTAISQRMDGNIIWDSISNLDLSLTEGSILMGAVLDDESCAGEGGSGTCCITVDESSAWIVTGDSMLTKLICTGTLRDADGNTVSIMLGDGTVLVEGNSPFTVTVNQYTET
ncbi:MAG: hypothetical protein J6S50_00660 [Oscillospiraceae bacterium]|nr:hypothetical protein [Oscillospiraceae bacterium]MBP5169596.1 hypothetical protein [Oscillospiraceae bacterium]